MSIIDKIILKSFFPKVKSVEFELKKTGVIRWFFGIILFIRFYQIASSHALINGNYTTLSIVFLTLIFLFTIGFFTPIIACLLILIYHFAEGEMATSTLGSTIAIHALFLFCLMNSGQYYSLDGWFVKKRYLFSKVILRMYSIIGTHTKQSLTKLYFLVFILYALISLAALLIHLQDNYWINALTIKAMFSNSFLTPYSVEFRWLENEFPIIISLISYIGFLGQSLFQFFMIPLIFTKWGSFFNKWWGMQFFIISLLAINLSYLPHMEIIVWLIILFPIQLNKNKVEIIYDDHCNLCRKVMLFLKAINFNSKIIFLPLSKNEELYNKNNLSKKIVKSYMAGWYKEKLYIGYDLYFKIVLLNPLLWTLIPIFLIGKFGGVGKKIYNNIAENRYKKFGVCEISFKDEIQIEEKPYKFKFNKKLINSFYVFYGILLLSFILTSFPYIEKITFRVIKKTKPVHILNNINHRLGLEIPNVFNKTDLSMGDRWLVLYRETKDVEPELVPITGIDGERLTYNNIDVLRFSNYNSDYLYFRNTLNYRRKIIGVTDFIKFHNREDIHKFIIERILYDYKYKKLIGDYIYKAIVYENKSSSVSHWKATSERHIKKIIFTKEYHFDDVINKYDNN